MTSAKFLSTCRCVNKNQIALHVHSRQSICELYVNLDIAFNNKRKQAESITEFWLKILKQKVQQTRKYSLIQVLKNICNASTHILNNNSWHSQINNNLKFYQCWTFFITKDSKNPLIQSIILSSIMLKVLISQINANSG